MLNYLQYEDCHYIDINKYVDSISDTRTLGDIHKAYFAVGIDVMRLKRIKTATGNLETGS